MPSSHVPAARRSPAASSRRGFTLIELMVVIVILGLLITLVVGNPFRALARGENETAFNQMAAFAGAIDMYKMEKHSLPKSLQDLTQEDPRTQQPYIDSIPNDPWGQPYEYRIIDERRYKYEISSGGTDKTLGGEDDIYYPKRDTEK